jgi:hypothetical protein
MEKKEEVRENKKTYRSPELKEYGALDDLTQGPPGGILDAPLSGGQF